jgi:hypothetical protein
MFGHTCVPLHELKQLRSIPCPASPAHGHGTPPDVTAQMSPDPRSESWARSAGPGRREPRRLTRPEALIVITQLKLPGTGVPR